MTIKVCSSFPSLNINSRVTLKVTKKTETLEGQIVISLPVVKSKCLLKYPKFRPLGYRVTVFITYGFPTIVRNTTIVYLGRFIDLYLSFC